MPRKFYSDCAECLMRGSMKKIGSVRDEALRYQYALGICKIIEEIDPEREAAPVAEGRAIRLRRELLGLQDDYSEVKHLYNALLMRLYPELQARVRNAADPLYAALQLSAAGNFIDFGVFDDVKPDDLLHMLDETAQKKLNDGEYARLREDLGRARTLTFVHDNCGEIVPDKLLIETILGIWPDIRVLSVVRACPVINDATMDDAREVNLADVAEVIPNGIPDVAGTPPTLLPEAVLSRLQASDVLISKGQGNFETLMGSGLNVYYLLLAKCVHYTKWFGFERFSAVLQNDRRMHFGD